MIHEEVRRQLNDYVDDLLPEDRRRAVAQHLEECTTCRKEWHGLQEVLDGLAALPGAVAPERDLWPEIADRLHPGEAGSEKTDRKRVWLRRAGLAAAAAVLMAFSSTLTVLWMQHRLRLQPAASELQAFETVYALSINELSEVLHERRDSLSPETVQTIETNLAIIDKAIRTSRAALAADPGNQELIRAVAALYEEKVSLLQRVTDLPTGS